MRTCGFVIAALLLCACASAPPKAANALAVQDPLALPAVAVLIFVRADCPIANRYAPTIRELSERHAARGARFVLVYTDADATAEVIARHEREYDLPLATLRDPEHAWALRAGVTVTPEVAVYDAMHRLVYRGRIDDRFAAPGISRPQARTQDLEQVLQALERGDSPPFTSTVAIGCPIPAL